MKQSLAIRLLSLVIVVLLCGCGTDSAVPQEGIPENASAPDLSEEIAPPAQWDSRFLDNTLDSYHAVVNAVIPVAEPADAVAGGANIPLMGDTRGSVFKKHLYAEWSECWDEVAFVDNTGGKDSLRLDFRPGEVNQAWAVGSVLGSDHYLMMTNDALEEEPGVYRCRFFEVDESCTSELSSVYLERTDILDSIGYVTPNEILKDASGNIHFYLDVEEGYFYDVFAEDGSLRLEYKFPSDGFSPYDLIPLPDGRIVLALRSDEKNFLHELRRIDPDTGKTEVLAVLGAEELGGVYSLTVDGGGAMVYANSAGVYRLSGDGAETEELYRWANHGIRVTYVSKIRCAGDGSIRLIYADSDGSNYLCLVPTTEQREIPQIVFTVAPDFKENYQSAVAHFNKANPGCQILLRDDYEQTALLTELIAGNGPALIDTSLTWFDTQEKLWEPLDGLLDLSDELIPAAMEAGRIGGTQYGLVTDFSLGTLITADSQLTDWDYDAFLARVQSDSSLEAVMNTYDANSAWEFVTAFLVHGIEDNVFFDAESGETYFGTERFLAFLDIAKRYCIRGEALPGGEGLLEGTTLCNRVGIGRPEDITYLRVRYGDAVHFLGYPTGGGASNFVYGGFPLAIRRSASEEEKQIAAAFLKYLLSYESQKQASKADSFAFSVRCDVLKEQFDALNEGTYLYGDMSGEMLVIGDALDREADYETFLALLEKARPIAYLPRELSRILMDEMEAYFEGNIAEDVMIEHLESRVGLYLEENR